MRFYVPQALETATHVWVRVDRVQNKLLPLYEGPFQVLELDTKTGHCKVNRAGVEDTIALSRIKPAFLQDQST